MISITSCCKRLQPQAPMTKSQELRQQIAQKNAKLGAMLKLLTTEKRSEFTDEESAAFKAIQEEIEKLEARAEQHEFVESRAANEADSSTEGRQIYAAGGETGGGEKRELNKLAKRFSFTRGLGLQLRQKPLDGVEKEMTEEARTEAAGFGESVNGVAIPSALVNINQRAATAGTAANAGNTIDTTLDRSLIETFRPVPKIIGLGARQMQGLTSNVEMVRVTDNLVSTWKGEIATADETDAGFEKIELRPKRLTAFTQASKQLLIQSSVPQDYENFLRDDLRTADELAIDLAAINGSGVGDVPRGVLNTTGIETIELGANGDILTRDILVDVMTALATKNVPFESLAWFYTPQVMAQLMKTKLDAGSGQFLLPEMVSTLLGFRTAVSTQVPSDIAKGTGTNLSALLFGNFREVIMGSWGGRDVVIDPYTKAKEGMVVIVTNSFHDVQVRRPKSFVAIKDIDTNA